MGRIGANEANRVNTARQALEIVIFQSLQMIRADFQQG